MRTIRILLGVLVLLAPAASAIPNQVFGGLARSESPLNDRDLTEVLLAGGLWDGTTALPGEWRDEAPVGELRSTYLLARPKVFGLPALMVGATHRGSSLDSLAITFADAGSWFGYFNETLPEGLSRRDREAEIRRRLETRQAEFSKHFDETLDTLRATLADLSDGRPRPGKIGKTRTLRAEVTDYRKGDFVLRLIVGGERLVRVLIIPREQASRGWLDPERAALAGRDRERLFLRQVTKTPGGDTRLDGLAVVPQGYRPYCGLNTLAMAARYFGLHLDEDWLAVAGKFQNTGSAAGSRIPRLYLAVANEAGLDLHKSNDFTLSEARSSLDAGLPVIVWRRFSPERNEIHSAETRKARSDPSYALPSPDPATRKSWPGAKAPLHASVIIGYNPERREVLFVESWEGISNPRRMRAEELEATAYLTFYFKP